MKAVSVFLTLLLVFNLTSAPRLLAEQQVTAVASSDKLGVEAAARYTERSARIEAVQNLLLGEEAHREVGYLADLETLAKVIPSIDDETLLLSALLVSDLSSGPGLFAEQQATHVVPPDQLRAALAARSVERVANIQEIQQLLSHDEIRRQVGLLGDLDRIEQAIPTLDDATLSRLATESRPVNDRLRAGVSTGGWIAIVAGVVALIIVLGI